MSGFIKKGGAGSVNVESIAGLEAYDIETTYQTGNTVKEAGKIWESLQDNNLGHIPSADNALAPVWWIEISATHLQNTDTGTDKESFNLGAAFTNGLKRVIKAVGKLANIDIEFEVKGTGKIKFKGASYVVSREKVFVLNINGEVIAQYDIEDEFIAVPATLTSSGTPGQKAWDEEFLYYCVAPNYWIKVFSLSANLEMQEMYVAVPAAANSPGNKGERAYDIANSLMYECVAPSEWVRYAVTTAW